MMTMFRFSELSFFLNYNYDFNVVVYHSINYILVLENPKFLFVWSFLYEILYLMIMYLTEFCIVVLTVIWFLTCSISDGTVCQEWNGME
jgi:hypothetical protein